MAAVPHLHPLTASGPTRSVRSDPWTTSHASAAKTPTAPVTVNATPEISPSAVATANSISSACSIARPARPASPNARAHPCSTPTSHPRRPSTSWPTSWRAGASDRPHGWSVSTATPSHAWPRWPDNTLTTATTSSWLFPPRTREVQFDEKWAFVGKKQKNCDPTDPADAQKGDYWDHVAYDPEHRLVLAVIPGARTQENAEAITAEVKKRLGGAAPALIT